MRKVLDGSDIGNPCWHTRVSWSDDGKRFAFFIEESDEEHSTGIFLVDTMTKEAIRLVSDVDVANFALSPDGENLAYISDDNMLSILNTRTKAKEDVYAIQ